MRTDYELVLMDVDARDSAIFHHSLAAVDQVLIPITPIAYDVWASDSVIELVDELRVSRPGLIARVVFNQAIPRTNVTKEALEALAPCWVTIVTARLHRRVTWKQSAGEGIGGSE